MVTKKVAGLMQGEPVALGVFLSVQAVAVVYFAVDTLGDLVTDLHSPRLLLEVVVALALSMGMVFGIIALRKTINRLRAQEQALAAASGELGKVIDLQFTRWSLTPAERDVGMLALKGLDVAEIADLRKAAPGTIRAQLTRIYAKAGVSGRAQFAAFFVEDLLGVPLVPLAA